jgi:DNA polymerase (family 10)
MLSNRDISSILTQYAKLYELHDGNPFKVKSLAAAAFNIKKIAASLAEMSEEELNKVPQLGKSLAPKILEIIQSGSFKELDELMEITPKGIQDILQVKGLGPKKVEVLWKTVGITSIPELLDACRENRLVEIKGFGFKTQAQILNDIEFKFSAEGQFHWAKMQAVVAFLDQTFEGMPEVEQYQVVGEFRRFNDIVHSVDYVLVTENMEAVSEHLCESENFELFDCDEDSYTLVYLEALHIRLFNSSHERWGNSLLEHTATESHLDLIKYQSRAGNFEEEENIYRALGLPFVLPELREGLNELQHLNEQDKLITFKDIKGTLHNHTTYSDGLHTLAEMAQEARMMGLEYIGICDHSQTASYAGGLRPERVLEQMREIDALNEKMAPFKIFKGIESDILSDGSLDYSDDILQLFDLVVASVHSNLSMNQEKAHSRLIKAIENPYSNILGHPTGRLLLMRSGYPIDHAYIIDACIANHVVIELNAHPYRLDLDWRWIDYALSKGGMISINPDAHQKEGLSDMQYGVNVARKGYLKPEQCLNALDVNAFILHLENKRKRSL